ncbi:MAG: hypothetical protein KAT58_10275, partial [candidate division Zixibacteria bacterium]|nr:hypothetical protein [candidate division Zixibacteria bacterium]
MKRNLLLLAVMILVAFGFTVAQAQDNGIPDTLYLELYPGDDGVAGYPADVRFNLRITNDIPDPCIDSIAGILIPLCFTSTNAGANLRVTAAKNNTNLPPFPLSILENSIFRPMPDVYFPVEANWMYDYASDFSGREWDTRVLDLVGPDPMNPRDDIFWMSIVPTGTPDQRFPGGSRLLTATMTFEIDDNTTICLDTCFWPPT